MQRPSVCYLFALTVLPFSIPAVADCTHQANLHEEGSFICHSGELMECSSSNWRPIGSCTRDDKLDAKLAPLITEFTEKVEALGLPPGSFEGAKFSFSATVNDPAALARVREKLSRSGQSMPATVAPNVRFCWIFYKGLKCKWDPC